jgi:hypothetical protein
MKGCVLYGKVVFPDGQERLPGWPGRKTSTTGGRPDQPHSEEV